MIYYHQYDSPSNDNKNDNIITHDMKVNAIMTVLTNFAQQAKLSAMVSITLVGQRVPTLTVHPGTHTYKKFSTFPN